MIFRRAKAPAGVLALIACLALAWCVVAPSARAGSGVPIAQTSANNPLAGNAMWIWYVSRSSGGRVARIAKQARRARISTVLIKSSDAAKYWTQFNSGLVAALHARGLRVCAWQFIYGSAPYGEAAAGARAVAQGADCLVLDVEGQYETKYASADRYMRALRASVGSDYPLALASFPYADYHPSLPYSVFLGPNGAQYNLPQMYWRAIGTTVTTVFSHTLQYNRPYGRPIMPLGQTYMNPKRKELLAFRRLSATNGDGGVSWWSWQATTRSGWKALRKPVGPGYKLPEIYPTLKTGSKGDLVVWAQQHLAGAGLTQAINGTYYPSTAANVASFQASHGLPATGVLDSVTWPALMAVPPTYVAWGGAATSSRSAAGGASAPESASLPSRNEFAPPAKRR
ncbi:MAG: peptidoglycan-binding domain-containing protein [Solirubrobacterales bacterium]